MPKKIQSETDNTPASDEDAAIIARCRRGDATAWDDLVDKYQRLIYAIPRRAGLDDEASADIFQEVFTTLVEKIDQIEQPGRIRSWLVTTAKFKTWGAIRGGSGFHSTVANDEDFEDEMASIADASPLADDVLIELEQQHIIRRGLQKLDEKCRTILSMLYLGRGASYVDVGRAIGVGETSISPMRTRCLKKLEKLLGSIK